MTAIDNKGNTDGARLLLTRLVKNETGWFSKFLKALEDTEHYELARELRGEPCNEDGKRTNTTKTSHTFLQKSFPGTDKLLVFPH